MASKAVGSRPKLGPVPGELASGGRTAGGELTGAYGRGRCGRCGAAVGKLEGVPHQAVCPEAPSRGARGDRRFHLRFEGDDPVYWLDLEVDVGATLLDLDRWLRRLWLDCPESAETGEGEVRASGCRGHRSVWEIWGVGYPIDPPSWETQGQSIPGSSAGRDAPSAAVPRIQGRRLDLEVELAEPLRPGVRLQVLYDLRAPTVIRGQVLDERRVEGVGRCEVLVRNRIPRWRCSVCSALAAWVCARCRGRRASLVCAEHRQVHASSSGCGGRWLWPVVNSPRMGCCSDADWR